MGRFLHCAPFLPFGVLLPARFYVYHTCRVNLPPAAFYRHHLQLPATCSTYHHLVLLPPAARCCCITCRFTRHGLHHAVLPPLLPPFLSYSPHVHLSPLLPPYTLRLHLCSHQNAAVLRAAGFFTHLCVRTGSACVLTLPLQDLFYAQPAIPTTWSILFHPPLGDSATNFPHVSILPPFTTTTFTTWHILYCHHMGVTFPQPTLPPQISQVLPTGPCLFCRELHGATTVFSFPCLPTPACPNT